MFLGFATHHPQRWPADSKRRKTRTLKAHNLSPVVTPEPAHGLPALRSFHKTTPPVCGRFLLVVFQLRRLHQGMTYLLLPFPMCLLVFSIVEFLFTFERSPRQNLFLLFEGSVNPSMSTLREEAWNVSPTRLFSS